MSKGKREEEPFKLMTEQEREEFRTFIEKTAQRVEKWPEWKRNAVPSTADRAGEDEDPEADR